MTLPRKKNPTSGIAIFIVVVVLLVLGTLLYNAITEKRDFERQNDAPPAASAAALAGVPSVSASTASTANVQN
ncbi:hypothetical protein QS306_06345 [Paraburkholderia bonniea]|uniref:hypothetical protein n=1 Tax=Paraburkholderia bonniea TaxID=2152891 RepID=UPI002572FFD6|nr:hypothetical protein [Paraburkholderia bonniea]WJF91248.1 hypothetical protein QS306_06345 [Paraburkholderia bonniea]WJF94563.1 hypothetical protein QS308_06355 [Paraburkholderia bonniea]